MTNSWLGTFGKVSSDLGKNCRIFINGTFSMLSHFFCISLYFNLSVHALDTVSIVCLFKVQFPLHSVDFALYNYASGKKDQVATPSTKT